MRSCYFEADGRLLASDSPEESIRFERVVRRYAYRGNDHQLLLRRIEQDCPDLAIVRIPATDKDLLRKFSTICDEVIVGDCQVAYSRDNVRLGPPEPPQDRTFQIREVTEQDLELLDSIVQKVFEGYPSHYLANPRLQSFRVIDGYREWARSYVREPSGTCYFLLKDRKVIGFTTFSLFNLTSELSLGGLLPEHRKVGYLWHAFRDVLEVVVKKNSLTTVTSVRVQNKPIHTLLSQFGFVAEHSFCTVHLNMLGGVREDRSAYGSRIG